jgi:hypothetical protein
MSSVRPENAEYVAVVSEWSTYAKMGGVVGNAYPVFNLTERRPVENPPEEFPNPGAVFLPSRGELETWDFVRLRPTPNRYYANADDRNCYYIPAKPPQLLEGGDDLPVAVVLEIPRFDPQQPGAEVLRRPAHGVTPLFFVRTALGRIFGPLRRLAVSRTGNDTLDTIQWRPANDKHILYEFSFDEFLRKGLKLVEYKHPRPELNEVLQPTLHLVVGTVATVTSERSFDLIPESQLTEWYFRLCNLPELPADHAKALREVAERLKDDQPEIIRKRFRRLHEMFARSEAFAAERLELARRYLETGAGKEELDKCLAQEIERRAADVETEVRRRQSALATERDRLEKQFTELNEKHSEKVRQLETALDSLKAEAAALEEANRGLQETLRKGLSQMGARLQQELPLLAALSNLPWGGGNRAAGLENPPDQPLALTDFRRAAPAPVRPVRPTKELHEIRDESIFVERLVADLAEEKLRFSRDFMANLYVALKAFPLNLVMGPPGYGKSSVVSALARALGHGEALLEVAVRRSWSDDRYLIGFYDAFHGRYDPGPTGLVGRLLQAERDWREAKQGVYCILLDEFNLAAPEYYFAQLLQVVTREAGPRLLRLFDPAGVAATTTPQLSQVELHPNVSFWGTINYDETTERLSPRVLDRTGMIFLSAQDVLASSGALSPSQRGAPAGEIFGRLRRSENECPDDRWDLIRPVLELLRQRDENWGQGVELSPRVFKYVQLYLANSVGVLDPVVAADFAFQQRVLPVLRGRGPGFAARVKALQEKLHEAGLPRSARHVAESLLRAEQAFGDIDFLAYE